MEQANALATLERANAGSKEDQRIIELAKQIGPLYPTGIPSLTAITQATLQLKGS